ncbi:hypothetical protein RRG08_056719 [Elysia crispata]|uniref:Uncharacterized protein n=1 Tax=Elysia crispata TaxID=231223 RepID=A0AAE1CYU9_9GAST|nr:hypothetical protein RRG08_056719 [Elysia crispata]
MYATWYNCFPLSCGISAVHTDALPPLTSDDLDRESSSTDMVLLTLCWDGHKINPQCQRRRTLLRELLYSLLFKTKPASTSYGEAVDDELEEDEPALNLKLLRTPSKGKRRDNNAGFYSDW